jgi:2-polyprenyl-6-methoxyphenol hydroxylase-like FAD-dependent oxidoreductase
MRVLISGAGIAGPALAYWLTRHGFTVTVVERAESLRRSGGHSVDLFSPAVAISEQMGVLPQIEAAAVRTGRMVLHRSGARRPAVVDLGALARAASTRHVEILRADLTAIYHDASLPDTEYVFGDAVTSVGAEGEVTFERGRPRRFDVVVGADGLHSRIRSIAFGPEPALSRHIGAYLAVAEVTAAVPEGRSVGHLDVGRAATLYGTRDPGRARVVFAFSGVPIPELHRDVARQKAELRARFAGMHDDVRGWLAELDRTPTFYFDPITQVRMDTWSRGRVTLVGDAGYCPGAVVGGGTSLAVLGAYVLAGELAAAGGDHAVAFAAYERAMADAVRESRTVAADAVQHLLPRSTTGLHALVAGARQIGALPPGVRRRLVRRAAGSHLHDTTAVPDYSGARAAAGSAS